MKKKKIGFLGLGLMGKPMAERMLDSGYPLMVYNRTKHKAADLIDSGAESADNPADIFRNNEVIISMVADFAANMEMLDFDPSLNLSAKMFIMMGTLSPGESLKLNNRINQRKGDYIEAPVLGSIPQVKNGSLFVFFGGSSHHYNKFKNLLEIFGTEVIYFGEVGKASAVKLAFNQLIAALTSAFSLSLGYLRETGVAVESFMEILRKTAIYAPTYDKKVHRMVERDYKNPNFPLKHMQKDVNLMVESFGDKHLDLGALKGLQAILEKGINQGLKDLDYSAMYNVIHPE